MNKVRSLGQIFTPDNVVKQMLSWKENQGKTLEPSCGAGAFLDHLTAGSVGIELDKSIAHKDATVMDYFDYKEGDFATVIGNPPYVSARDMQSDTFKKARFCSKLLPDAITPLHGYFIEHSINKLQAGGELIFIVPVAFSKSTCFRLLNKHMSETGAFTHWYDFSDTQVFPNASVDTVAFRWVKGAKATTVETNLELPEDYQVLCTADGQLYIGDPNIEMVLFSDYFTVKVGAVTGADELFYSDSGSVECVIPKTKITGETARYFGEEAKEELAGHSLTLIKRKSKKFDETNWWKWAREPDTSTLPRVYVCCRSRQEQPFFLHDCGVWSGSILAIFPKKPSQISKVKDRLNNIDWATLGFRRGDRYWFNQRSLENAMIPKTSVEGL